jgi:hypothetical protein
MCVQKEAVTVAEMARMVGLCRSRFYQLIGNTFPTPVYDLATRRPYYPPELQRTCIEVRRRGRGVDGKLVLFQSRHSEVTPSTPQPPKRKTTPDNSRYKDLVAGLRSLGLASVTTAQVEEAVKELHVPEAACQDQGAVLRAVFLHLQRRDTSQHAPTKQPPKD